jgi:ferredoxin-NADP reductase
VERAALLERLTARRAPIIWHTAAVREIAPETAHAKTIVFDVPEWPGHTAGQHVDVRLTAEDGYQTERSYSIASAPEDPAVALTVEQIDDGEVSPYLVGELRVGDVIELRGPVGGHFTWRVQDGGPLLLIAGGSGLVPLMAMLRHRAAQGSAVDARLLVSSRAWEDVLYRDELARLADESQGLDVRYTLTRVVPPGWSGFDRRIDADMLAAIGPDPSDQPRVYVCGPTPFVERAADLLVAMGHDPGTVRAERFGPTGG